MLLELAAFSTSMKSRSMCRHYWVRSGTLHNHVLMQYLEYEDLNLAVHFAARCIDRYVELRSKPGSSEEEGIDNRLTAIIERMFERCLLLARLICQRMRKPSLLHAMQCNSISLKASNSESVRQVLPGRPVQAGGGHCSGEPSARQAGGDTASQPGSNHDADLCAASQPDAGRPAQFSAAGMILELILLVEA